MKYLFACIAILALVAVCSAEDFSIGELKGGPIHESITFSSFNSVFTRERAGKATIHSTKLCKELTSTSKTTDLWKEKFAALGKNHRYGEGKWTCENVKDFPSIDETLQSGSQWNDMPCLKMDKPWKSCMTNMLVDFLAASKSLEKGEGPPRNDKGEVSVVANSHFGMKQYYHSMAPTSKDFTTLRIKQRDLVKSKILHFARQMWNRACDPGHAPWALTYIARILHMVQDSYSEAHVYRASEKFVPSDVSGEHKKYVESGTNTGDVIFFQGYDAQDHTKHASLEGLFGNVVGHLWEKTKKWWQGEEYDIDWSDVKGSVKARYQCKKLWKIWQTVVNPDTILPTDPLKCKAAFGKVESLFVNDIYKFAKVSCKNSKQTRDAGEMYAGGSRVDIVSGEVQELDCAKQSIPFTVFQKGWKQFDD